MFQGFMLCLPRFVSDPILKSTFTGSFCLLFIESVDKIPPRGLRGTGAFRATLSLCLGKEDWADYIS